MDFLRGFQMLYLPVQIGMTLRFMRQVRSAVTALTIHLMARLAVFTVKEFLASRGRLPVSRRYDLGVRRTGLLLTGFLERGAGLFAGEVRRNRLHLSHILFRFPWNASLVGLPATVTFPTG